MHPGLVIFDCDGTLVDSEAITFTVWVEAAAEHGVPFSLEEALQKFKGGTRADCMAELERRLGRALPDDFGDNIQRRKIESLKQSLKPIPGAVDLVRAVRTAKCVASNGLRAEVELSLSLTGLLPHFVDRIFSAHEVGAWKPDPGLFLHAARTMGVAPESCVVVEDSVPGVRAGLAAGMTVVAFQPHGRESGLPKGVRAVESLGELQGLLAGPEACCNRSPT